MNLRRTTAHFVGGPWDGQTEQLHGAPDIWNVPLPPIPQPSVSDDPIPDCDIAIERVVYQRRECWTWEGVPHARYEVWM